MRHLSVPAQNKHNLRVILFDEELDLRLGQQFNLRVSGRLRHQSVLFFAYGDDEVRRKLVLPEVSVVDFRVNFDGPALLQSIVSQTERNRPYVTSNRINRSAVYVAQDDDGDAVVRVAPERGGEAVNPAAVANKPMAALLGDVPAVSVIALEWREHHSQGLLRQKFFRVQGLIPSVQVLRRRVQSPGRVGDGHIYVLCVDDSVTA